MDHAANERKAAALAMSMVVHYPDKDDIVREMIDLAMEEMAHFREVIKIMLKKGIQQIPDKTNKYIGQFLQKIHKDPENYLLDRLLMFSIVEKRGAERFGIVGEALTEPKIKDFYTRLAAAEYRHYTLFIKLAYQYYPVDKVTKRLDELLQIESDILQSCPFRAAVH
ncbi:tRNA-(ms[2]io[6]A)-hydroxylase [hydrothermal vent metagenome]|uniref:tRNA-(Ms[2]io[6]A)-hydroxylase n=1 Tax=hydrothermal vent metagenome TaxID=652676 RepID=A0A3B0V257_9ZZZZ